MARKKFDFKPDRTESGTISKLYLTRKQRLFLLKWLLYALVLLVLSVLQDVVLCRLRVFGATTELVPCAIFAICILHGSDGSCVFCLAASLFYLFSGTAAGPYVIVIITFLGIAASGFRQGYLRKGFSATMLCTAAAMMLYELTVFAVGLLLGHTILSRAGAFCLTGAMSLIAAPILYPILLSIEKIGGETWKE